MLEFFFNIMDLCLTARNLWNEILHCVHSIIVFLRRLSLEIERLLDVWWWTTLIKNRSYYCRCACIWWFRYLEWSFWSWISLIKKWHLLLAHAKVLEFLTTIVELWWSCIIFPNIYLRQINALFLKFKISVSTSWLFH